MIFDDDETTSVSQSSTAQTDARVAATDNAIVVQLSDGSQLTVSDPGAQETIRVAVDSFENLLTKAINFADDAAKRSHEAVTDVLQTERAPGSAIAGDLLKYGAVVALGFVAMAAFSKR